MVLVTTERPFSAAHVTINDLARALDVVVAALAPVLVS
jgi:hypothetical protein